MARSSRASSGSTSRVPVGIDLAMRGSCPNSSGRRRLRGGGGGGRPIRRDPLDPGAEAAETLVDPLVAAIDLDDVADLRGPSGGEGGDEHRHPGADVGALEALAVKPAR